MVTKAYEQNTLDLYEKRIEILLGARFEENSNIDAAIKIQDKIRKKIGHWSGSEEISKWRRRVK